MKRSFETGLDAGGLVGRFLAGSLAIWGREKDNTAPNLGLHHLNCIRFQGAQMLKARCKMGAFFEYAGWQRYTALTETPGRDEHTHKHRPRLRRPMRGINTPLEFISGSDDVYL